jgi:uncharacterized membrane protein YccC
MTPVWRRYAGNADLLFGVQLALAVVLAFVGSASLGMKENFWAVMSALIVVRPSAGSTMGAGWDRVRGAFAGTLIGLAGVAARHVGLPAAPASLALVALLAFGSALTPMLRSAPITALIVLGSGGIAGHSALQVAGLRVAEIVIGVAAGLLVSLAMPAARAARRFDRACAATLRRLAREVGPAATDAAAAGEERAAAGREELRQLAILAVGADRELRWFGRRAPGRAGETPRRAEPHRQTARLISRIAQDAALPGRLFDALPRHRGDALWTSVRETARDALDGAAAAFEGGVDPDLAALRRAAAGALAAETPAAIAGTPPNDLQTALAGPLRLLAHDLGVLVRLRRRETEARAGEPRVPRDV